MTLVNLPVEHCRPFDLSGVQAYLAGLTFALAASPCSTPVLATLLGYVAASRVCGLVKFWGNWYFENTGVKDQKENKNKKGKKKRWQGRRAAAIQHPC